MIFPALASILKEPSAGFDPLSIAWTSAYWAEDPDWTPPIDGGVLTGWRDAGSAGLNISSFGASVIYQAVGLGGRPTVQSTSGVAYAPHFPTPIAQPNTIVIVGATDAAISGYMDGEGPHRQLIGGSAGNLRIAAGAILGSAVAPAGTGSAELVVAEFDGGSSRLLVNGSVAASGNAGTNSLGSIDVFRSAANARASFFGVFDGLLPAGDQSDLLDWAQSHYGIA